jgi:hypothetical protein
MNVRFEIQTRLRNSPFVLEHLWRLRDQDEVQKNLQRRRAVQRGDDLVIEGYPRSANTFALDAFLIAQERDMMVGNHIHSPAQFALARKYGIPAMLVLREPKAAALSHLVFSDGWLDASDVLRSYVYFHRPLLAIREAFVVATFEEVTSDFGLCIQRLNRRFGTAFAVAEHTPEFEARVMQAVKARQTLRQQQEGRDISHGYSAPHEARKSRQEEFAGQFDKPGAQRLLAEASRLYERLADGA